MRSSFFTLLFLFFLSYSNYAFSEEISDILTTHSYTLYNRASTVTREFKISSPSNLDNLAIISTSPLVFNNFVMCKMRVYQPNGLLINEVFCDKGGDTRILSPTVSVATEVIVKVDLQYFDNTLPTNTAINFRFNSRFRFSDTAVVGDEPPKSDPPKPEPVEPVKSALLKSLAYRTNTILPSRNVTQTINFKGEEYYSALVGFNISSSYSAASVDCLFQVRGIKTVDGNRKSYLLKADSCNQNNRKLQLFSTPDNPVDFEQVTITVTFINRHVKNSAYVTTESTLIRGSTYDEDLDGLPAWYEEYYNLSDIDYDDAFVDSDGDGYSNIEEYLGGTDPNNDRSFPNN